MLISFHQCVKIFVSCSQVCIPRQVSYLKDAHVDHENTANCLILPSAKSLSLSEMAGCCQPYDQRRLD